MFEIKPIVTEQDYENALALLEPLFEKEAILCDEEAAYFDALVTLIERYEQQGVTSENGI